MSFTATVVVPTLLGGERLERLLDSLRGSGGQVLVVDNSANGVTSGVASAFPEAEVLTPERNLGFSLAVNLAAGRAEGEALVLVNDDCVCDPGFVAALTSRLDPGQGVVMSAGVMRESGDRSLIDTAGMELDRNLMVLDYMNGEPVARLDHGVPDPIGPSGAAAAFDRAAFLEVGGFDEALFAYWEDVDLVLRLVRAGGRCRLATDASGTHEHSATLGPGSSRKNYLMGYGRGYVLRKWNVLGAGRLRAVLPRELVICAGQAAVDRTLSGVTGRVRGYLDASPSEPYPGELLPTESRASALGERARRRARLRRRERSAGNGEASRPARTRPHILIVSYLFPPTDASAVRRAAGLRAGLEQLGVRTTVLTSTLNGPPPDRAVIAASDLRTRMGASRRMLTRPDSAPIQTPRRRVTRLAVPDSAAFSWLPTALLEARGLMRRDPPDAVFTTSPPESVHLVGIFLRRAGVPWIADLRDGWTIEKPIERPYMRRLDDELERAVLTRADLATAVTAPIAADLRTRFGLGERAIHLTNGFDPDALEAATDERSTFDPERFSLVYTGSGGIDGKDPRPFLAALAQVVAARPELRDRLEVVFAGSFTEDESAAMRAPELEPIVRSLGRVPHERALGLQRESDGLLLITSVGATYVANMKLYEYLAAGKPMLALADRNAAVELLARADNHTMAPPDDPDAIVRALDAYLQRWMLSGESYAVSADFDLDEYTYPRIAERLLGLLTEVSAIEPAA